jgi:hypothetical protein
LKLQTIFITTALVLVATLLASAAPIANDEAAFAQIKSLAGDWESKDTKGTSHVHYEVVSGGSAVLERFENDQLGAANAMVTVYYIDGGHLMLTHYCMAKNQPRMQAEAFDNASGTLHFHFVDATGLSGSGDGHMHNATFHFIDENHFATDWQFFEGGKPKMTESVQYTRQH